MTTVEGIGSTAALMRGLDILEDRVARESRSYGDDPSEPELDLCVSGIICDLLYLQAFRYAGGHSAYPPAELVKAAVNVFLSEYTGEPLFQGEA